MVNRRGNVYDTLSIMFVIFVMVIVMLIVGITIDVVNSSFQADDDIPAEAKYIINHGDERYLPLMDFWAILFLVGFPLISAVFAYFTNVHPLFFWVSLVIVIVIVLYASSIKVFWDTLETDTLLKTHMDEMPMTSFVFNNFTLYGLFAFTVVALGTYVKLRDSGGFV